MRLMSRLNGFDRHLVHANMVCGSCFGKSITCVRKSEKGPFAFEQEPAQRKNHLVTTATFMQIVPKVPPPLNAEVIDEVEKDSVSLPRV